ncbi:hypothetical protein [Streptacidiphilus sp. PAMC 29251]
MQLCAAGLAWLARGVFVDLRDRWSGGFVEQTDQAIIRSISRFGKKYRDSILPKVRGFDEKGQGIFG